jgi:hypothetical protein
MVLEDVTEVFVTSRLATDIADEIPSDPVEGNGKLPKILLNGNKICMVS